MAIILRFIDDDFTIQQRLVRFGILEKSLVGQELARELGTRLSTTFQIPADKVVADSRDGAAVNGAALRQLRDLLYPKLLDLM